MGTKLTELRDGCFHKAMDDEPMFVLLARDPTTPLLIDLWASTREREIREGKRPASDMDQVNEARETANKMREWRKANDGAWRAGLFGDEAECHRPPHGWRCTRGANHSGPCAAIKDNPDAI